MIAFIKEHYIEIAFVCTISGVIAYMVYTNGNGTFHLHSSRDVATQTNHVAINYVPEPPSIHNVDISFSYQYLARRYLDLLDSIIYTPEQLSSLSLLEREESYEMQSYLIHRRLEVITDTETIQMLMDAAQLIN